MQGLQHLPAPPGGPGTACDDMHHRASARAAAHHLALEQSNDLRLQMLGAHARQLRPGRSHSRTTGRGVVSLISSNRAGRHGCQGSVGLGKQEAAGQQECHHVNRAVLGEVLIISP